MSLTLGGWREYRRCNASARFLSVPSKSPLNWGLHMTRDLEEHVPFVSYVRPGSGYNFRSSETLDEFPLFASLPAELQLRVLGVCPAPTLFHIMHASSALRKEAMKLFWAHSEAYYLVPANWIAEGGYPGDSSSDLGFAKYVQNVELLDERLEFQFVTDDTNGARTVDSQLIVRFWQTLLKICPAIKKIVINRNWQTVRNRAEQENWPEYLEALLDLRPKDNISVRLIIRERETSVKRGEHSRQQDISQAETVLSWQKSFYHDVDYAHQTITAPLHRTILMPLRKLDGRVGSFYRVVWLSNQISLQRLGLAPLMVEAFDRHHLNENCSGHLGCPVDGCLTSFSVAGSWTLHVIREHCELFETWPKIWPHLPAHLKEMCSQHQQQLSEREAGLRDDMKSIQEEWSSAGTESMNAIRIQWMEQLTTDKSWYTGKQWHRSTAWSFFLETVS